MNFNNPFAEQSQYTDEELMTLLNEDPDLTSAPHTTPETSLPHGSVGQNEFGQDFHSALSNDQYWQDPPPETLANNSSYYDQEQPYTSGSVQPGQFVPGIYSPGGYEQVRLQYQHRTEPTVALDTPSSLDNGASYSPAAANPSYNTGTTDDWNDQISMHTSGESVPGQSASDWNLQGGYNHGETGRQYQPENNVAFGSSSSLGNDFMNPSTAANPVQNTGRPVLVHDRTPSPGWMNESANTPIVNQAPTPTPASSSGRPFFIRRDPSLGHRQIPDLGIPSNYPSEPVRTSNTSRLSRMQGRSPGYAQPLSTASSPFLTPPPHRGPDSRHAPADLRGSVPTHVSEPGRAPVMFYPSTAGHPPSTARGPVAPPDSIVSPTPGFQYGYWPSQAPGLHGAPEPRHPSGPQHAPGPQYAPGPRVRSAPPPTSATPGTFMRHHPPVTNHNAPVINHPVATGDPPAPQLSENKDGGTGEQAAEGADSAGAVKSTTPKHILEKEKQARAAIRKLKAKTSMDGQMGESITMVRTNTGVEFSGTMWKAPANDMTIPTTEKDIKACVDALDVAMHNVLNIREKADVKSSNNRWNSASKYYFPEEYNAAAGLLVKELIKIHTDGWTKQIFDQNEREQCQLTQFYTFEDRFEGLRELLHYSKTSCQDIMKGSRFYTIIANPRNLIHRTATNKTANVNKGQQIRAGKVAMKKGSSTATSSSGEDKGDKATQQDGEEGSNSEESTKVKKASRGKKRAREETFVAEDPAGQPPRKKAPAKKGGGA